MQFFRPLTRWWERAASSLPGIPLGSQVNYHFSDDFIVKYREQLSLRNTSLLKAQEHRIRLGRKNRINTDRYLSKLINVLSNERRCVVPIGSSVNGLDGKNSDLDVVLITDLNSSRRETFCEKFKRSVNFRRNQMNAIASVLSSAKLAEPKSFQQVLSSNLLTPLRTLHAPPPSQRAASNPGFRRFGDVPILKFISRDGIMVDLQFNNIGTIRSSLFVRSCVQFSFVVPVVVHWINSFFEAMKLKNSRHGLFSTYHLNMLALHFLQTSSLQLLPDMISSCPLLRPNTPWEEVAEILTSKDAEVHIMDSNNVYREATPAEIIIKMIDYYSQVDLHNVSIDICGKTFKRIQDATEDSFIQLIDPYFPEDTSPHARCSVRNGPSLVQQAFTAVRSDLAIGNVPKVFLANRPTRTA